jgi:hypothetical protein
MDGAAGAVAQAASASANNKALMPSTGDPEHKRVNGCGDSAPPNRDERRTRLRERRRTSGAGLKPF